MADEKYKVEAVATALDILELISKQRQEPIGAKEIAQELRVNHTTAFRLLLNLDSKNYVRKVGDKYVLGMAAALLWARYRSSLDLQIEKLEEEKRTLDIPEEA